jgi:hypothetical protein
MRGGSGIIPIISILKRLDDADVLQSLIGRSPGGIVRFFPGAECDPAKAVARRHCQKALRMST